MLCATKINRCLELRQKVYSDKNTGLLPLLSICLIHVQRYEDNYFRTSLKGVSNHRAFSLAMGHALLNRYHALQGIADLEGGSRNRRHSHRYSSL